MVIISPMSHIKNIIRKRANKRKEFRIIMMTKLNEILKRKWKVLEGGVLKNK